MLSEMKIRRCHFPVPSLIPGPETHTPPHVTGREGKTQQSVGGGREVNTQASEDPQMPLGQPESSRHLDLTPGPAPRARLCQLAEDAAPVGEGSGQWGRQGGESCD